MKKRFMTLILSFSVLGMVNSALAHSNMAHASSMHTTLHILTSVSVLLALIVAGFFVFKKIPQSIKQRIKK